MQFTIYGNEISISKLKLTLRNFPLLVTQNMIVLRFKFLYIKQLFMSYEVFEYIASFLKNGSKEIRMFYNFFRPWGFPQMFVSYYNHGK